MSRLTNDLGAVRMLFGPGLLNLMQHRAGLRTTLWLLVHLSPRLTCGPCSLPGAAGGGAAVVADRMYTGQQGIQEQLGVMSTSMQEDLAGIAVIKHYTLEPTRGRSSAA